eukprot:gnl/MRDRNA2_/MRDRNA2_134417_c0_seq1.p1 gnl/MRDRNA2_/MRDRNA2_134417_c0~~gnl/MRDRNA2_/MRDRNA2_134417_c0_seq1.p1  ORF type:complete len:712 (+),score=142.88 gnl/MRDRNA2_/MRDRNA2_134417_c0_seq1:86-2137(+)
MEAEMTTKLEVDQKCMVKEYALGNTLFLIANELTDSCAARWKVHSSTCDVLLHAHDGKTCDQLWKFRLISDQCHAPLIVVHSDNDMMDCYNLKVQSARDQAMLPMDDKCASVDHSVLLQESAMGSSEAIQGALLFGLQQTAQFARKRYIGLNSGKVQNSNMSQSGLAAHIRHLHSILDGARQNTEIEEMAFGVMKAAKELGAASEDAWSFFQAVDARAQYRRRGEISKNESLEILRGKGGGLKKTTLTSLTESGPSPLDGKLSKGGKQATVIDDGSGYIKIGKAGSDTPDFTGRNVVGTPKYPYVFVAKPSPNPEESVPQYVFSGKDKEKDNSDEEERLRGLLQLQCPIKHGIITDFEMMDKVWEFGCKQAGASGGNVLVTEPPLNPKENKKQIIETLKTKRGFAGVYVAMSGLMALFGAAKHTGIVLDVGDSVTHIAPVVEGYTLPHAVRRVDMGGHSLTLHMQRMITESPENKGRFLYTSAEFLIAEDIKITKGFLADSKEKFDADAMGAGTEEKYDLPDDGKVTLTTQQFRVGEPLFQPTLIGVDSPGVHDLLIDSILSTDMYLRQKLWENIVLSGGTTKLGETASKNAFPARLEADMKASTKIDDATKGKIQISADPKREFQVWLGGAIVASLNDFETMFPYYTDAAAGASGGNGGPSSGPFEYKGWKPGQTASNSESR